MSDKLEIVVSGPLPRPEIELNPAAFEARRVALAAAEQVQEIATVADLDAAAAALTRIKGLTKSVEDSRKEVKAPVLEVGKRIDQTAKEYLGPLEAEARRLAGMVGTYQEAEKRKAERIRQEEAEKQRIALAEMAAKQAQAMAAGDVQAADAARAEAADRIAESQLAVVNAEGPRTDGIVTRTAWKFEVTDAAALYAARPELCIIEANGPAIRAILKANNGKPIPGLRIWQEAAAVVRNAAPVKAEDYDY